MYKIIVLLLLCATASATWPRLVENTLSYRTTAVSWLLLIRPLKPALLFFDSTGSRMSRRSDFSFVINWWYFGRLWNRFMPAWKLNIGRNAYQSIANSNLDKNLGVTIYHNTVTNKRTIDRTDLVIPKPWITSFYVWPLLIHSWVVQTEIYRRLSHRARPTQRTFIIIDASQSVIFWVTMWSLTLPQIVRIITWSQLFTWSYHVINIDWWSSTAFRTQQFQFGIQKRLPRWFVVE